MGVGHLSPPDPERDEDRYYPMNVSIVVATCGTDDWEREALATAWPSALAEWDEGRDGRTAIRCHYPEMTVAQARNQGAKDALGDWLCFLDADDELEEGYLDAMEHAYEHKPVGVVGETPVPPLLVPMVRRVHEEVIQKIADGFDVPRRLLGEPLASVPNLGRWPQVNECVIGTLVHRAMFEQVGGFRDYTNDGTTIAMYEDWDLWLRCWDAGAKLVYTDAVYREHVSTGRNTNAHLAKPVYDAIWADHLSRAA